MSKDIETADPAQTILDVNPIETLAAWMAEHPDGFVGAVTPAGLPTALPPDLVLGPDHQTDDRSLLQLVAPDDMKAVTDAFVAALTRGIGVAKIRMASEPSSPLWLRYVDLRETHGVLIRLVTAQESEADQDHVALRASAIVSTRPRLGVMTKDEVAKILSIDTALSLMLGWSEVDMVGHQSIEFIHPDDHVRAIDNWMSRMNADQASTVQTARLRYLCKDGSWLWLETSNEAHLDADNTTVVVARLFDVSDEMAAVEALRLNESFLRRLTDTVPVGLFHIASDGTVAFVNPVLRGMIGDREVASHADLADALLGDKRQVLLQAIEEVLSDAIDVDLDVSLAEHDLQKRAACRVNLRAITDDDTVLGVLGCVVDVTELRSMATTDGLTGLQNRRSILDALSSEMEGNDGHVAAIYLDLDLFKPVNDRYGHHVGDQLLKAVAERLRGRIRASDQAARLGGDEFLVICPGIDDHEEGLMLARRVQSAFNDPFHVVRTPISITASVGVTCGTPGVTAEELVTSADGAMYEAKRSRGGPPVFRELARPQAPQIMGGSADY